MRISNAYNPALGASRLLAEANAFGKPQGATQSTTQPATQTRSSALESVPASAKSKYARRQFYLKIEGLTERRAPLGSPLGSDGR